MLQERTSKPVLGIFQAAITHSLLSGKKFGIVTTGQAWVTTLTAGVSSFLGANASDRFAGVIATNIGVLELKEGNPESIKKRVEDCSGEIARRGAGGIIIGCAGKNRMTNMTCTFSDNHQGWREWKKTSNEVQ